MSPPLFPVVDQIGYLAVRRHNTIYWAIIIFLGFSIALLPIIKVEISVRSPGMVRPDSEKTIIRSLIPGTIERIFQSEGRFIEKDSLILTLKDNVTQASLNNIDFDLRQKEAFINDLELITSFGKTKDPGYLRLSTPLYQRLFGRFLFQSKDQAASISKVSKELLSDSSLYAEQVISKNEYFNKSIESQKLIAGYEAFQDEQISIWHQQLSDLRLAVSRLESQRNQLLQEKTNYQVRASVSGIIQGLVTRYEGGFVQAGELICELSPETKLIAECYVPSRDVGFLKENQLTNFTIDAFDHNYFGVIKGHITRIDNDFTLIENTPVFKVRCEFDSNIISLRNGYTGRLKKGLKLQARFIIARRSIAQLLFDKIDDWLNPVAFK